LAAAALGVGSHLRHNLRVRHSAAIVIFAFAWLASRDVAAQEKFALSMFHFNVQYVCGGTIGWFPNPQPELELDNDTIEDRIITESFAPIVELFEKHPSWGVDLEMQAYMLDIIAARHPALLDKMRVMAKSGQIDIVSFHYSDQLFIGYPEEDLLRSNDLARATFDKHDIPLSRTVFCQEGQAASGMAAVMAERGYRNMVWPKNLWSFQHGDFDADPLYSFGDVFMVAGAKGVRYDDGNTTIDMDWTFFDDGELLATNDANPYLVELFFHDPAVVAEYETRLLALEADGYRIATVDQYVEAVKDQVTATVPPPLLDGTWQPDSTGGVRRWLGGSGLWLAQERDNHVRTMGMVAHRELVAAETAVAQSGIDARDALDAAWRLLFLGQVTDASGINPFRGEIEYGISHMAEALRIAREQIDLSKEALGLSSALIDPAAGTIVEGSDDGWAGAPTDQPPLELTFSLNERATTTRWETLGEGHWRVTIEWGPSESNPVGVRFVGTLDDDVALSLALDDAAVRTVTRSDFDFESFHLALPTGWIGLGNGRFVIKDMGHVHIAAELFRESGDIVFHDDTAPVPDHQRWVFHVLDGTAEQAAALAIELNVQRRLVR
jgi:hypothetical protein